MGSFWIATTVGRGVKLETPKKYGGATSTRGTSNSTDGNAVNWNACATFISRPTVPIIPDIKIWDDGTEGKYNFPHNDNENFYVLNNILVDNIELCNLLIMENDI